MSLYGAVLVIGACFSMGYSEAVALKRQIRCLRWAMDIAVSMTTWICVLRLPLFSVLDKLHTEYPMCFPIGKTKVAQAEAPFEKCWIECMKESMLIGKAAEVLEQAGVAISRGEYPETVMDRCRQTLSHELERVQTMEREKGRLYMVLGAAAGCLLVLVLV